MQDIDASNLFRLFDFESRKLIVEHVKTLCSENKLAVLWATHLIDEVDEKGKLIVLDKGEIVEQGNHDELIKNDSYYKKLIALQSFK